MIVAQISDPHLTADGAPVHGVVDADEALRRTIAAVNALVPQPDVVLVTGDLTHDGALQATHRVRCLLMGLHAPVQVVGGNHDLRNSVRAVFGPFPEVDGAGGIVYAVEDYAVRLLALDASTDDPFRSTLPESQVVWLAARLAEAPTRPTILFLHHPPFDTGIAWLDEMGIAEGRHEIGALIAAHGNVAAILCGHLHRPMRGQWYGVPVLAAPSVMNRVIFSGYRDDDTPIITVTAPPGFVVHHWSEASGLCSTLHFLDGHAENWGTPCPDPCPPC
ncbi:MAG: phosphodiesterase [Rhodospirillaceae bacterium]|nr:phosphodiesterase [Rhodospirillaceae bacterium]